jgi:hypothetical protein
MSRTIAIDLGTVHVPKWLREPKPEVLISRKDRAFQWYFVSRE